MANKICNKKKITFQNDYGWLVNVEMSMFHRNNPLYKKNSHSDTKLLNLSVNDTIGDKQMVDVNVVVVDVVDVDDNDELTKAIKRKWQNYNQNYIGSIIIIIIINNK